MEIENLNKFLQENKIDLATFEKVIYSILKLLIYKNGQSVDLYEPNVDMLNYKFKIRNTQSNDILDLKLDKTKVEKILGQSYLLSFRNYLVSCVTNMQSLKPDIEKLYELAETNNSSELQITLDSFVSTHKNKLDELDKKIDELDAEHSPRNKRLHFLIENFRYCSACQENPCMCSDPDPS